MLLNNWWMPFADKSAASALKDGDVSVLTVLVLLRSSAEKQIGVIAALKILL